MLTDKKVVVQFTVVTFIIAYLVSGVLIALGQFGYTVYSWVNSLQQFLMNIPFAVYILSPAIASYIVLKKNNRIENFKEWLKTVFYIKNKIFVYLFVAAGLILYFLIHIVVTDNAKMVLPLYMFFLSLPGNFFIGGLEETGWMYILQPALERKYGFVLSSVFLELSGFYGMYRFSLFQERIMKQDSLTSGCFQYSLSHFAFFMEQSTKYQVKAMYLCVCYFI